MFAVSEPHLQAYKQIIQCAFTTLKQLPGEDVDEDPCIYFAQEIAISEYSICTMFSEQIPNFPDVQGKPIIIYCTTLLLQLLYAKSHKPPKL